MNDTVLFFMDLLFILAEQDNYKERATVLLLSIVEFFFFLLYLQQDIYPGIDKRIKDYMLNQIKQGYV